MRVLLWSILCHIIRMAVEHLGGRLSHRIGNSPSGWGREGKEEEEEDEEEAAEGIDVGEFLQRLTPVEWRQSSVSSGRTLLVGQAAGLDPVAALESDRSYRNPV